VRQGEPPDKTKRIECVWRNPATPTLAAQVDAVTKLVATGILPATSDVALEMAGLTEEQRQRVASERRREAGGSILDRLSKLGAGQDAQPSPEVVLARQQASADGVMGPFNGDQSFRQ
jgi:hypothetical protein